MGVEVAFIGGPSGVGKTSVGFELHAQLSAGDIAHCVIDGDFFDMAHSTPWEHRLAERNLSAMWANYRALGFTRLIYINTVSVLPTVMDSLLDAMGRDLEAVAVLLTCTGDTARERLGQRERGSELDRHVESSAEMAVTLQANCPSTVHRVPTDARTVSSVAADVVRLTGWLPSQSVQVRAADVDDDGVPELLALAVGGGQDRLDHAVEQYRRDPQRVLLCASIGQELVGLVGYTERDTHIEILHIATSEAFRRAGVGRRMVDAVRKTSPRHLPLVAETDSEAVNFYIANGFVAESLGEKYLGVERYRVYDVTENRSRAENRD